MNPFAPIFGYGQAVRNSAELQRILALSSRELDLEHHPDLTDSLKTPSGTMKLWPIQNVALLEAKTNNGGFFPIGVGHGKTLIALLAPVIMHSRAAVLLVPPQLKQQLLGTDIPRFSKHFQIPVDRIHVVAYSELSSATKADILTNIQPDLIIADEAHCLKHKTSARTRRVLRYFKENSQCRFVALSGTMTVKSIKDYAHLCDLALRERSPLPRTYIDLEEWSAAIDSSPMIPMKPGALLALCKRGENDVRVGFRNRLVHSFGIVSTKETEIGSSLIIRARRPELPRELQTVLQDFRSTWSIGGEEIEDALGFSRVARMLSLGFYYKWEWPGGVVDYEWLSARAAWHSEVRHYLSHCAVAGMDSPLLLAKAAQEGRWKSERWAAWSAVKRRPAPPIVPVWISDFLVRDVCAWVHSTSNGIIWVAHPVFGQAIAQMGGLSYFGEGREAAHRLTEIAQSKSNDYSHIVRSIRAGSDGFNLQYKWSNNLFTCVPNGAVFEQAIGRTHRRYQTADEVITDVYLHTEELEAAFESALKDAAYIEATQGLRQKLNYAQRVMQWNL